MAGTLTPRMTEFQFDEVYCSDLQRAVMTKNIILSGRTFPVHYDDRLRERNFGKMEGHTHTRGMELWPQEVSVWLQDHTYTMEGGETFEDFNARVDKFVAEILRTCEGKTILVVAHGGSLRSMLKSLGSRFGRVDMDYFITHACYSDLTIDGNEIRVNEFNSCEHLVGI